MTDPEEARVSRAAFPAVGRDAQFEERYRAHRDPWRYAERAVEVLRHERIASTANALVPQRILEIGCALGEITGRLRATVLVCGIDVSPTAASRAQEAVRPLHRSTVFSAASVLSLPFRDGAFDLVIASDGLWSWGLSEADRGAALEEIERVLSPGGHAILTEHLRPSRFEEFVQSIAVSRLQVARVAYLADRPSYQLEASLKAVRGWWLARALIASRSLARALRSLAGPLGAAASRHILVVARRQATAERLAALRPASARQTRT